MFSFKKVYSLLLAFVLLLGVTTVSYASDFDAYNIPGYTFENYIPAEGYTVDQSNIPADLPEGTIRIGRGLYVYTPTVETCESNVSVTIATLPAFGSIANPTGLRNVTLDVLDNYIWCKASKPLKINFIRNNFSLFGDDLYSWPNVGTKSYLVIDAIECGMERDVAYRAQVTGVSSLTHSNVTVNVRTNPARS